MTTPTNATTTATDIVWKQTNGTVPLHVVQAIPIDSKGNMLVMHRGPNVRSARNVWSFPSGMHDIGESSHHCIARELDEEFNLRALPGSLFLGEYENIAGDPDAAEQYHWVITLMGVKVYTFDTLVNREPEKHDQMVVMPITMLFNPGFLSDYPFHPSFSHWFGNNRLSAAVTLLQFSLQN